MEAGRKYEKHKIDEFIKIVKSNEYKMNWNKWRKEFEMLQ